MKLFLDTTVIVSAYTRRNLVARSLLDTPHTLLSNEYAVKETRRILAHFLSSSDVNEAMDDLRARARILPNPDKRAHAKLEVRDKSDRPIVFGAMQANAVLVTEDHETYFDAKRYVKTALPREVFRK